MRCIAAIDTVQGGGGVLHIGRRDVTKQAVNRYRASTRIPLPNSRWCLCLRDLIVGLST
jgi:hypothetical protein